MEVASESVARDTQPQSELQRVKGLLNKQILQRKKIQLEQKTHTLQSDRPVTQVSPRKSPIRAPEIIDIPLPPEFKITDEPMDELPTAAPPMSNEMRGFRRQESADSLSTLDRFDKCLSESEPAESGDNVSAKPRDPLKAAARFGKKTAAALGLDTDDEADDEISDAESQRMKRLLAASEQTVAAQSSAMAADAKSCANKAVRVRRIPAAVIADRSRPRSLVHDLQMGGNLSGSTANGEPTDATTMAVPEDRISVPYTTTDDDDAAEASPHRPARVRRIARCRPSVSSGVATAKPAAAAAAAAVLSDDTVDFIVGSWERRCVALAATVKESFGPVVQGVKEKAVNAAEMAAAVEEQG